MVLYCLCCKYIIFIAGLSSYSSNLLRDKHITYCYFYLSSVIIFTMQIDVNHTKMYNIFSEYQRTQVNKFTCHLLVTINYYTNYVVQSFR